MCGYSNAQRSQCIPPKGKHRPTNEQNKTQDTNPKETEIYELPDQKKVFQNCLK